MTGQQSLRLFLVAGESSGDALGAAVMAALVRATGGQVRFSGIGGPLMTAQGLDSLFPVSEIAVMGPFHILRRLPALKRRLDEAVAAVLATRPDILLVIDSPEFTQRLAKRVRSAAPDITIVKYVAPQIWAWRRGRGRAMRPYIDHVLALLPFEPGVYRELGGPETTYVGHPMIEMLPVLQPSVAEAQNRGRTERPTIVVLPGSRVTEVERLIDLFGDALGRLTKRFGPVDAVIPAVPHLADLIRARVSGWPILPRVVEGPEAKLEAFRSARAALAASGTVTLELALAGVPTVVAYKVEFLAAVVISQIIKVDTAVLANLVLGEHIMPEFLQWHATPEAIERALVEILSDGPGRERQVRGLAATRDKMLLPGGEHPADAAARVLLDAHHRRVASASP